MRQVGIIDGDGKYLEAAAAEGRIEGSFLSPRRVDGEAAVRSLAGSHSVVVEELTVRRGLFRNRTSFVLTGLAWSLDNFQAAVEEDARRWNSRDGTVA